MGHGHGMQKTKKKEEGKRGEKSREILPVAYYQTERDQRKGGGKMRSKYCATVERKEKGEKTRRKRDIAS